MSDQDENSKQLSLEHRILIQVRQVLASVVRDVTPPPGMQSPLSPKTIEDIRGCFALITARERELGGKQNPDLPVFVDDGATTRVVDFKKPED
ncbi:MAG: segregation and condensation protein A [Gammaproteobacteria bacterium]|nr:segregation and condensation protein A [Gammaproteobacteria bacterium]